jgi:hypothetical protein
VLEHRRAVDFEALAELDMDRTSRNGNGTKLFA